jgi:hypothetical protein
MPAKELAEQVKRIVSAPPISMQVTAQDKGAILTAYKEFPGELHIVRHWQERTRFRIQIMPDWDDPAGHSTIQITEHTQQRASSRERWHDESELERSERSAQLLRQIDEQLKSAGK